jgi:hypothetical protein
MPRSDGPRMLMAMHERIARQFAAYAAPTA